MGQYGIEKVFCKISQLMKQSGFRRAEDQIIKRKMKQLKVKVTWYSCHNIWEWYSQPKIGNLNAGNFLLSMSILYGGASPTKVLRVLNHINLKAISNRTFLEHQTDYLQPATIRIFEREQRLMINRLPEDEKLVIGGDGRADSPGHSAKYGSYRFMDMKRKKILDIQLVQVRM